MYALVHLSAILVILQYAQERNVPRPSFHYVMFVVAVQTIGVGENEKVGSVELSKLCRYEAEHLNGINQG